MTLLGRFTTGSLVGILLTGPVVALFYVAWQRFELPFAPFDLFDWLARSLPGGVVTFAIDALSAVILASGVGRLDEVAKVAEQVLALAVFGVAGALLGALGFAVAGMLPDRSPYVALSVVAAPFAAFLTLVSWRIHDSLAPAQATWLILCVLAWGLLLGWTFLRLVPAPAQQRSAALRLDRRRFLVRLGGTAALLTVTGAGVGRLLDSGLSAEVARAPGLTLPWSASTRLPNYLSPVAPVAGTRPELTPLDLHYRIDINLIPPRIAEESWRLRVFGLVERALELTMDEIKAYPRAHQFVTLSCISNQIAGDLIGTQRWTGVSLQRLLPDLALDASATHLLISSADGFYEVVSLETVRSDARVMLAYAWDGLPLSHANGFPLRIFVPDLYGMKQPKWIESIEAIDSWQAGYWVRRGWSAEARVKATSVIDTVTVTTPSADREDSDGGTVVALGGIAYTGARGVSRVQVRVGDGDWQDARLRTPLSDTSWVVWRYDWPYVQGDHELAVRCFEADGTLQVMEESPVRPDGATGLHSLSRRL